MATAGAWPLLAATYPGALLLLLAAGLLGLFVFLAVLVWTRFGQARPVSKCVVLSLLAHLLLLIYAYSTHVLFGPPGVWTGQTVRVRLRDAADSQEAATVAADDPQPWDQAGQPDGPLLDANAQSPEVAPPAQPVAQAAPPSPPPLLPQPVETPPADAAPQPEKVAATEPAPPAEPKASVPEAAAAPPAEMPALTDLLPENQPREPAQVAADASPPETAPPPEKTGPTEVAAALPPMPEQPLPDPEFVAATPPAAPAPRRLGDGQEIPQPLQARVAANRLQAAQPFGATPQTEAAVNAALAWLRSAQSEGGRWDANLHGAGRETRVLLGHDRRGAGANADTGVTGLALLAFLGSGETHLAGKHRETVQHGLEFLLASQAANGSLAANAEPFASMYSHGIAALALAEAYALSGDERLLPGLRLAVQYTIQSQHAGGGWRYQPYDAGDMSQFGWQLMALKSAELGGLAIPPATRERMTRFLRSCSTGTNRGLAAYRPGDRASRTMTAEALVCRHFLRAEDAPQTLAEGVAFVSGERPGIGPANFYYWYYGTLALFQQQGDDWQRWNAALQRELLSRQRWDGRAAGSFDPDDIWGGCGGRVYSTALAALSLEVYYRYTPLHGGTPASRLTDRQWQPAVPR